MQFAPLLSAVSVYVHQVYLTCTPGIVIFYIVAKNTSYNVDQKVSGLALQKRNYSTYR